jgi:two-component system LytT family response regulator
MYSIPLTCVIVDDDAITLKLLHDYASGIPDVKLMASFSDPNEGFSFLSEHPADLLFLDVEMPGLSGIEFLGKFANKPQTIFITGHSTFAFEAFQLDAIDYLLKPVSFSSFLKAINKAKIFLRGKSDISPNGDSVFIRSDGKYYRVLYRDILYIEGMKDYVVVQTNTSRLPVAMNLTTFLKQLTFAGFIRVHKSFVINFNNMDSLTPGSVVIGNASIPIGKAYSEEILTHLSSQSVIRR